MQTWRVIYNTIEGDDSIWIDANDVKVDANNPNAVIADSIRIDFMMPVISVRIVADLEGSSPAPAEVRSYEVKMLGITRIGLKAGDVLVVKISEQISAASIAKIENDLQSIFPENKVVVYSGRNIDFMLFGGAKTINQVRVENGLFPLVNSQVFTSKSGEVCGCSLPLPPEGYCGLCGQRRSGSDGD